MAKLTGFKFTAEIEGIDKKTIAAAKDAVVAKLQSKFPIVVSDGRGKEKVSITVNIEQK